MNHLSNISEYINVTRKNNSAKVNSDYYNKIIIPRISDLFDEAKVEKNINVVHSSLLRSEVVTLADKAHLIYDQNLGQCFNQLNRILYESKVANADICYFHKIASTLMSNYDNLTPEATYAILFYLEDREIIPPAPQTPDRLFKTFIQEIYIICHELMHEIYKDKSHRYHSIQSIIDEFCNSYIEAAEHAQQLSEAEMAEQYAAFPDAALGEPIDYGVDRKDEQERLARRSIEEIRSNPHLKEELFCDFWAAMWTLGAFKNRGLECLDAIFLGHFNLRIITEIDWSVQKYADMIEFSTDDFDYAGYASNFGRSRINLELCSFLAAALQIAGDASGDVERLSGDLISAAFYATRLMTMRESIQPEVETFVSDYVTSKRRDLISQMAVYYKKLYDGANGFMFNGLLGGLLRSEAQASLNLNPEEFNALREEMSDPVRGREYTKKLADLLS